MKTPFILKNHTFLTNYDPPFFLHKIHNYDKAIYERKGHWTQKEKIKYGVFLQIFRDKFEDELNPILNKMFRVMSDFIKTRNHNQCRSHHQKMERERFQIDSILESIKSKYHPREYEFYFQKYSRHIKTINIDVVLNQKGFTPDKNMEKRKKIKFTASQNKFSSLNDELKFDEDHQNVSKNQNIARFSEVLNRGMNRQSLEQNKIQFQNQKQKFCENEIFSKSKEEKAPQIQFSQVNNLPQQLNKEKNEKNLKKTGLQYDSEESDEANINYQKPKVAYFDMTMNFSPTNLAQKFNLGQNLNREMIPDFIYPISAIPVPAQFQNHPFEPYRNFENQFSSVYRMKQNDLNHKDNFVIDTKSLEERKNWHLSEASRLCLQMNENLEKANNCEQMMEMIKKMKQMAEPRGENIFFPNFYANTQF